MAPPSATLHTGAGLSLGSPGLPDQSAGPQWDDQHVPGESIGGGGGGGGGGMRKRGDGEEKEEGE